MRWHLGSSIFCPHSFVFCVLFSPVDDVPDFCVFLLACHWGNFCLTVKIAMFPRCCLPPAAWRWAAWCHKWQFIHACTVAIRRWGAIKEENVRAKLSQLFAIPPASLTGHSCDTYWPPARQAVSQPVSLRRRLPLALMSLDSYPVPRQCN